jgi:hypothetical protein
LERQVFKPGKILGKKMSTYGIEGRASHLKRDCTVRALHVASGIDYDMCYLFLAAAGRKNNCGAYTSDWLPVYRKLGLCQIDDLINLTHEVLPCDNVIICIRGHIYAIRNGVHSDGPYAFQSGLRRNIQFAWRIPASFIQKD